jgi:hypothetical protein
MEKNRHSLDTGGRDVKIGSGFRLNPNGKSRLKRVSRSKRSQRLAVNRDAVHNILTNVQRYRTGTRRGPMHSRATETRCCCIDSSSGYGQNPSRPRTRRRACPCRAAIAWTAPRSPSSGRRSMGTLGARDFGSQSALIRERRHSSTRKHTQEKQEMIDG